MLQHTMKQTEAVSKPALLRADEHEANAHGTLYDIGRLSSIDSNWSLTSAESGKEERDGRVRCDNTQDMMGA